MKRILWTAVIAVLFSSLAIAGFAKAEIFWNRDVQPNPEITDKDFKFKYGSSESKSLGDMEVYDERKPAVIEPSVETEPQPAQNVAPIAPAVTEPRRPKPSRSTDVLPSNPNTVVKPTEPSTFTSTTQKKEAQPSGVQTQGEPEQRLNPTTSVVESTRPAAKRMRWGQKEEPKSNETENQLQFEEKPKYRWGQ